MMTEWEKLVDDGDLSTFYRTTYNNYLIDIAEEEGTAGDWAYEIYREIERKSGIGSYETLRQGTYCGHTKKQAQDAVVQQFIEMDLQGIQKLPCMLKSSPLDRYNV